MHSLVDTQAIITKEKKKALKTFYIYPTTVNREHFNQCKRAFRNEVKEQKKEKWTDFINSTNDTTNARIYWNKINQFSGKRAPNSITALKTNNTIENDPTNIANILAVNFTNSDNNITEQRRAQNKQSMKKFHSCESPTPS